MDIYLTTRLSPSYHQFTWEDLLLGTGTPGLISENKSNTRTVKIDSAKIKERFGSEQKIQNLIYELRSFNKDSESLRDTQREKLYNTFYIPKRSRGFRRIDAPNDELMNTLRRLKSILENDFGLLYHTSAFAYVKHRCTVDAVKRHQQNNSKWFAKLDLSNFFGSTTKEFVLNMFSRIYPLSEVMCDKAGKIELERAIDLAFLNGGLPQGTPVSPTITNVMMIPVDFELTRALRDKGFVYTRYADDFMISSKTNFSVKEIENIVSDVLKRFGAPFAINGEKTRYGSSAGSNWMLGVMLNKENEITVGAKRKRQLKAALHNYAMDKKNGIDWEQNDVQVLAGNIAYCRSVETNTIDNIIEELSKKTRVNIRKAIKEDLKK